MVTPTIGAGKLRSGNGSLAHEVRDAIRNLIESKQLRAGDKLPSESEFVEELKVGRTTVREAFRLLEQEGIVVSKQGLGRFVRSYSKLKRPLTKLEGVTEMLASRGFVVESQVVSVVVDEPTPYERERLELAPSSSVVRLRRLRRHQDRTVVYSDDVFDRLLVPLPLADVDWSGSLFGILDDQGCTVTSAAASVSAVLIEPDDIAGLDVEKAGAWLLIDQLHRDSSGRPVIHSEDYHRGEDFSFDLIRTR